MAIIRQPRFQILTQRRLYRGMAASPTLSPSCPQLPSHLGKTPAPPPYQNRRPVGTADRDSRKVEKCHLIQKPLHLGVEPGTHSYDQSQGGPVVNGKGWGPIGTFAEVLLKEGAE